MIIIYLLEIQFGRGNGVENIGQKKACQWLKVKHPYIVPLNFLSAFNATAHRVQLTFLKTLAVSEGWILCNFVVFLPQLIKKYRYF